MKSAVTLDISNTKPPLKPKPAHLSKKAIRIRDDLADISKNSQNTQEQVEHVQSNNNNTINVCSSILPHESFVEVENSSAINLKVIEPSENSSEESQNSSSNSINEVFIPNRSCLYNSSIRIERNNIETSNQNSISKETLITKDDSFHVLLRQNKCLTPRSYSCIETSSIDSEVGEENISVRRRVSSWFSSFNKERKFKTRSESLFYIDSNESQASSLSNTSIEAKCVENPVNSNLYRSTNSDTQQLEVQVDDLLIEDKLDRKAYLIVKELITSEIIFIDALKLIVHDFVSFINHYSSQSNNYCVIPKKDLEKLISSLPQLLHLNEDLLQDLEKRIQKWKELPKIADVIVKKGPFLKLYSSYIKHFEEQCSLLDEYTQRFPKFGKALNEFESTERCKKLSLKHYMLKPVQRIPQYRLLLRDYQKNLKSDSIDYNDTINALNIINDVLHHANSTMKEGDNFSKLLKIQSALTGDYEVIKPGRTFIKEGELSKLSRKEIHLRYFILMSDCLLYTIISSNVGSAMKLKLINELSLKDMKVCKSQRDPIEFDVISSIRSFSLRARTVTEKTEWVDTLKTAIKEYNQKQSSFYNRNVMTKSINNEPLKLGIEAPVWLQDQLFTMCAICTAEFSLYFRRHHCRCCGKVICRLCSCRAPLQYKQFNSKRVCESCFEYLLKEYEDRSNNLMERIKMTRNLGYAESETFFCNLKYSFKKKKINNSKKICKSVPQRLKEVTAFDTQAIKSGWLYHKIKGHWKQLWFVLKDQVLYEFKASHDVIACNTIPVLGYDIEQVAKNECDEANFSSIFRLSHPNQFPLLFATLEPEIANEWITILKEAAVLK